MAEFGAGAVAAGGGAVRHRRHGGIDVIGGEAQTQRQQMGNVERAFAPGAIRPAFGTGPGDMAEGVGAGIAETVGIRRRTDAERVENCNDCAQECGRSRGRASGRAAQFRQPVICPDIVPRIAPAALSMFAEGEVGCEALPLPWRTGVRFWHGRLPADSRRPPAAGAARAAGKLPRHAGIAQTVLGPLPASRLGYASRTYCRWASLLFAQMAQGLGRQGGVYRTGGRKVKPVRAAGVSTIVDPTPYDVGRDIRFLEEVSRKSELNMIACTGQRFFPPNFPA